MDPTLDQQGLDLYDRLIKQFIENLGDIADTVPNDLIKSLWDREVMFDELVPVSGERHLVPPSKDDNFLHFLQIFYPYDIETVKRNALTFTNVGEEDVSVFMYDFIEGDINLFLIQDDELVPWKWNEEYRESTTPITLQPGECFQVVGWNPKGITKKSFGYSHTFFHFDAGLGENKPNIKVAGNIMSLLDIEGKTKTIPSEGCFEYLFGGGGKSYGYTLNPGFAESPGVNCVIRKLTQEEIDMFISLGYDYYNYVELYDNIPDESTGWMIVGDKLYQVLRSEYVEEGGLGDIDLFYVDEDIEGVDEHDKYAATYVTNTNTASGDFSHAEGYYTTASGHYSHAEGQSTTASGTAAHAEGQSTTAQGRASHAEGQDTTASNTCSHAEGQSTTASNTCSHAEGQSTTASGTAAHAEGQSTTASNTCSHAEGQSTTASGYFSHAEGYNSQATNTNYSSNTLTADENTENGRICHAEGNACIAQGYNSHAEGKKTFASGGVSHAEGGNTTASGDYSHAEGFSTTASNLASHAEGAGTRADGVSHAEGGDTVASGTYSHAEGNFTTASGNRSHAEGFRSQATNSNYSSNTLTADSNTSNGSICHAEGNATIAQGYNSHAEGRKTFASGGVSHAEGLNTIASGYCSHAEGNSTTASEYYSHAEGYSTTASGPCSHAEGRGTTASGIGSHSEGYSTTASGNISHAEGISTQATHEAEHAQGKYNKSNSVPVPQPIEYVDMGTSVLWAKWNLGATSETEYGDYYAWGETEPKSSYTWEDYKWGNPNAGGLTKYNSTDGKTGLDPEDDAAHVNLGGGWRMPTKDEINELISKCTYSWKTDYQGSGVNGGLFTAQNGNTLFIPNAGRWTESGLDLTNNCLQIWSKTLDTTTSFEASYYLYSAGPTSKKPTKNDRLLRYIGNSIRPVISPSDLPSPINTIHSTGIGTADNDRKNAFEIMDNGDVYVKGIGGYDGTNPGVSDTIQQAISDLQSMASSFQAFHYKGTIGVNGDIQSLPATHDSGDTYVVSDTGTYAGVSCTVGDYIICKNTSTVASDTDWNVIAHSVPVTNNNTTLVPGTTSTIATVEGVNITVNTPTYTTPVIDLTSDTSSSFSIDPNKMYMFGEKTDLTITGLVQGATGFVNEYMFQFTSGNTATTLLVPNTVSWMSEPDIQPNKKYAVSIENNLGIIGEWNNE